MSAIGGGRLWSLRRLGLPNWRLVLLGVTAIALSLASGYTTWDGMTNFTCPARGGGENSCIGPMVLSFLITLGIQGVMLIAAWLIGESFAQGMWSADGSVAATKLGTSSWLTRLRDRLDELGQFVSYFNQWIISLFVLFAAVVVLAIVTQVYFVPDANLFGKWLTQKSLQPYLLWPTIVVAALILVATILQRETIAPYVRGTRIIAKNLPIWMMFILCMATSVFFSFDSLFSNIFPHEERRRAADIRTTKQVSGVIADLDLELQRHRSKAIEALFKSSEWNDYGRRLGQIVSIVRSAQDEIIAVWKRHVGDKAAAEAQLVRLEKDKEPKIAEIDRLKRELPLLVSEVERLKGEVFAKDSEIIAKRAEAQAEDGGVGGTLKIGKGPEFKKRQKELDDLEKLKTILVAQLRERETQLADNRRTIAAREAEIAQIDGEIRKLNGTIRMVEELIGTHAQGATKGSATGLELSDMFVALEGGLAQFRERPERAGFLSIQQHCSALLGIFDRVPALKERVSQLALRCEPDLIAEPAQRIFALNTTLATFRESCAKPERLPQNDTDALLAFGNTCIQTSGLAAADTVVLRNQLNRAAQSRDDKAHRFVVTWNAFLDGNQLAYLALSIAVAMDALVFMSGLFAANVVQSPLSRAPRAGGRSASDLEAVIHAALLPDPFFSARTLLEAFRPITNERGFSAEVRIDELNDDEARIARKVLTAASGIGAVERDLNDAGRYLVRTEFTEFLGGVCRDELLAANGATRNKASSPTVAERTRARHEMSGRPGIVGGSGSTRTLADWVAAQSGAKK